MISFTLRLLHYFFYANGPRLLPFFSAALRPSHQTLKTPSSTFRPSIQKEFKTCVPPSTKSWVPPFPNSDPPPSSLFHRKRLLEIYFTRRSSSFFPFPIDDLSLKSTLPPPCTPLIRKFPIPKRIFTRFELSRKAVIDVLQGDFKFPPLPTSTTTQPGTRWWSIPHHPPPSLRRSLLYTNGPSHCSEEFARNFSYL